MRMRSQYQFWQIHVITHFYFYLQLLNWNKPNNFDKSSLQICSKTEDQDDDGDDRDVDEYDINDEVEESVDDTGIQGWW